jgi:branched-subunit amino acid aminotransferase/4-amino-4-deoxychorismate lyase
MSLPEDPIVYWDSEFIPLSKALVPVSDRGYSHGDGVFCALTITDGVVELWEEHFLKFSEDAQYLNLTLPNLDYLGILKQVIEANGVTVGKWKTLIMASGECVWHRSH